MGRYFFDVRDGDVFQADEDGVELKDFRSAQREAVRTLGEIARDKVARDESPFSLVISVRYAEGPVMEVAYECRRLTRCFDS